MTEAQARAVADEAARRVLEQQTAEHRRRDPAVDLRLEDYEARVVERATPQGDAYDVSFVHANPDVAFAVWTGHPMHFTVRVGPEPDRVDVVPGE